MKKNDSEAENMNKSSQEDPKKNTVMQEVIEWVKMIVIVVVVVILIDGVVLINAKIPSASMENTIMTGDRIFGFRMAYGINIDLFGLEYHKKMKEPERFDIVIFKYPDDEKQRFIKRIIGLPGEKVEIKGGKEAAWKFMRFMTGEYAETEMAKCGQIPVNKAALESDTVKNADYAPFIEAIQTAKARPTVAAWSEMDNGLQVALTAVVNGEKTAQEALDELAAEWDALLK